VQLKVEKIASFQECQLCGFRNDDICYFRMWRECDDADQPIPDKILITCKEGRCFQMIEDDPRLFLEIPWSQGGPGKFILLCGDCPHRQGFGCTHPKLKANGGDGLEVKFTPTPWSSAFICGDGGCHRPPGPPATFCEGNPNPPRRQRHGEKT